MRFLSRRTSADSSQLNRLLLIVTLLLGLVSWQHVIAQPAAAAGYNTSSQGDCVPGYPRGVSSLNWWGYFPLSWGHTVGYLSERDQYGNVIAQVQATGDYRGDVLPQNWAAQDVSPGRSSAWPATSAGVR